MTDTVLDRFLRYVVIDTQSDPSSGSQPSTEKQTGLGRVLVGVQVALSVILLVLFGLIIAVYQRLTKKIGG